MARTSVNSWYGKKRTVAEAPIASWSAADSWRVEILVWHIDSEADTSHTRRFAEATSSPTLIQFKESRLFNIDVLAHYLHGN